MITFGQMPDRLEAAGLTKLTHQRCRQLAEEDPNWPIPMDEAVKVGRMRLFDWHVLEPYFRNRKSRQGQHPDRQPATEGESVSALDELTKHYGSESEHWLRLVADVRAEVLNEAAAAALAVPTPEDCSRFSSLNDAFEAGQWAAVEAVRALAATPPGEVSST